MDNNSSIIILFQWFFNFNDRYLGEYISRILNQLSVKQAYQIKEIVFKMSNEHFFIVGAQRSGTTFLYNMLDKCDTICMAKPVFPEPKYLLNRKYNCLNYKSYLDTHFKHQKNEKILGEKGTSYIEYPETSILITKFLKIQNHYSPKKSC